MIDSSEPPNGDFARYLEQLTAGVPQAPPPAKGRLGGKPFRGLSETGPAEAAPARPPVSSPTVRAPDQRPPPDPLASSEWGHRQQPAAARPLASRAARFPTLPPLNDPIASIGRFVERVTIAMIVLGGALVAASILLPNPWVPTPLPGAVLLFAGLALRKQLARRRAR